MKKINLLILSIFWMYNLQAQGCLEAPNGQYPDNVFKPTCSDRIEIITDAGFSGEYSVVEVKAGASYQFFGSLTSDYITISNDDGTEILTSGYHNMEWIADKDRIVRFYVHTNENCGSDYDSLKIRAIKCNGVNLDAYCEPILNCMDGATILDVNFGEISNQSECGLNGYNDFTAQKTAITKGIENNISMKIGYGWVNQSVTMWIDYNRNFIFDEDEYFYIGSGTNEIINGKITIPVDIPNGEYQMRLRVATVDSNLATWDKGCDSSQYYGETEDYSIIISEDLSVSDNNQHSTLIYPNPVNNIFKIDRIEGIVGVALYNIQGQRLKDLSVSSSYNISDLPAGLYILKIKFDDNRFETLKLLKK
ncbi:T9SS type A sorting domain-containing protein [Faecalibacter rhinopitheci]|uniref:T9SS type A sorting domain-containing protein n=1 Tax=Faecalibacter rhinopitheci TaxID=2779678 RepID=A0A8J7G3H8_9FLAO|nr:T9SS type A sorting domain-containing protein [Faecalibacter rhinopitheci]MBF0596057.1 T9SS type A sorting domain-containing protein [Faecalibacter rhinopitheci]